MYGFSATSSGAASTNAKKYILSYSDESSGHDSGGFLDLVELCFGFLDLLGGLLH